MPPPPPTERPAAPPARPRRTLALAAGIVLAAGALSGLLLVSGPRTEAEEEERTPQLVQVVEVRPASHPIVITAHGSIVPARELTIRPEVSGKVVRHHPALGPGGRVRAGEELLLIDPADYRLRLAEKTSALEEAQFELSVEQGRQVVARHEWDQLKAELGPEKVNESLVLREPHLERARARVAVARNQIELAELDLARTTLSAPFNAVILEESVEEGQLVSTGDAVVTLAGTDTFWMQAAVPVEMLRLLRFAAEGEGGSAASVTLKTGGASRSAPHPGEALRLLGDLDASGRLARVLVRIDDPLYLREPPPEGGVPLLLGSYAEVEFAAGTLDDALEIERKALREGDVIWLCDRENKLQVRPVEILWRQRETVLVADCLQPGETLVVSGMRAAVPGTRLNPQPAS